MFPHLSETIVISNGENIRESEPSAKAGDRSSQRPNSIVKIVLHIATIVILVGNGNKDRVRGLVDWDFSLALHIDR